MNEDKFPTKRPTPLSEEAVGRLLERFFDAEVPQGLRAPATNSASFGPRQVATQPVVLAESDDNLSPRSPASRTQSATVVAVAAVAVLAGILLIHSPSDSIKPSDPLAKSSPGLSKVRLGETNSDIRETATSTGPRVPVDLPGAVAAGSGVSVRERVEPGESFRFDSSHGPVEQRSERRITNVSIIDPETGSQIEVELPELTIEIIPIKD